MSSHDEAVDLEHAMVSGKRIAGVLGGLSLGAVGGFVGSLLRQRPPTIYADGLESVQPPDDSDPNDGGVVHSDNTNRANLPVGDLEEV